MTTRRKVRKADAQAQVAALRTLVARVDDLDKLLRTSVDEQIYKATIDYIDKLRRRLTSELSLVERQVLDQASGAHCPTCLRPVDASHRLTGDVVLHVDCGHWYVVAHKSDGTTALLDSAAPLPTQVSRKRAKLV